MFGVLGWARTNLLYNVIALDEYALYMDTDSIKLKDGFNMKVIENYNRKVLETIENVSKDRGIPIERFLPKDKDGIEHTLRFI